MKMDIEALRAEAIAADNAARTSEALRAFGWLCECFDIGGECSGLTVGEIPDLVDAVEAAIVGEIRAYVARKAQRQPEAIL